MAPLSHPITAGDTSIDPDADAVVVDGHGEDKFKVTIFTMSDHHRVTL
jgi:hypothetical protein